MNSHAGTKKPSTLESSSKWMLGNRLETKDLNPSVVKFCAGLPTHHLKEITEEDQVIVQGRTPRNGKD